MHSKAHEAVDYRHPQAGDVIVYPHRRSTRPRRSTNAYGHCTVDEVFRQILRASVQLVTLSAVSQLAWRLSGLAVASRAHRNGVATAGRKQLHSEYGLEGKEMCQAGEERCCAHRGSRVRR